MYNLTDINVSAYNPSAESNYVAAITALRPAAEAPEAIHLQPSPEQLMVPIHRLEDQLVIGETSLDFSLDLDHTRARFVPSIPVADDGVLGAEQPTKFPAPSMIMFEKKELETTPEHTPAS
nr:hypothetical protein [Tanacetum cinerariifolium]